MKDRNGVEIAVGQTVKERAYPTKAKVVRLDDPFVYIDRKDAYDDAPVFPADLVVIDTHSVEVRISIKADTEDKALAQVSDWVRNSEKELPKETLSYKVVVK